MKYLKYFNVNESISDIISYDKFLTITEMDDIPETKDFYNNTIKLFESLPDPLKVYRFIMVDDINDIRLDEIGTSWTWSTENWDDLINSVIYDDEVKSGDIIIKFEAEIDKKYISWKETMNKYITQCLYHDIEESEIVILPKSYKYLKKLKWEEYD